MTPSRIIIKGYKLAPHIQPYFVTFHFLLRINICYDPYLSQGGHNFKFKKQVSKINSARSIIIDILQYMTLKNEDMSLF